MNRGQQSVVLVGPVPPPIHGGALAMELVLGLRDEFPLRHVDSRFGADVGGLGKLSLRKVALIGKYSWQLIRFGRAKGCRWVVVTPTFYLGPFLKDAVFIWVSSLLLRRQTAAWLHMDFRVMRYAERPAPVRWFIRRTLLRCDRFIVVSDGLKTLLPDWIPAGRVEAIANGVESPDSLPPGRRGAEGLRVVYLSNLAPEKGWRVALEAGRALCARHPELEFVFYGNPAFEDTEEVIANEFSRDNADGRIRYSGPVYGEDKWQALADADIFCFPSFHEAFPLSVLEAMAAGLPIVATKVGAVADAVEDGTGGSVVDPRDAGAMESALERMIIDRDFRRNAGAFNRQRFLERYTVDAYRERWRGWLNRNAAASA